MSLYYSPQSYNNTNNPIITSSNSNINTKSQQLITQSQQSILINDHDSITHSKQSKKTNSTFHIEQHDPTYCVCQTCDCGQHKCKLQCTKPQFRPSTTYSNSYRKTNQNFNPKTNQSLQFTPKKTVQKFVDTTTTYQQKYPQKQIHVQKPIKHKDHQGFSGPSLEVTTYQSKYPGYNGKNPYVKKKPDNFRGGLQFKGKTAYNSQFLNKKIQVNKPIKHSDNLRSSSYWFGKSSYKQAFKVQNPQQFKLLSYKPSNRYQKRPASAYQFESSYNRVYEKPIINESCPAKDLLKKLTQSVIKMQSQNNSKRLNASMKVFG